jgi:hypothetical protein
LTNPDNTNIINFDLWKQAAGGRHQIGTLAGFKSEQVAGFLLECMAGFVGIRTRDLIAEILEELETPKRQIQLTAVYIKKLTGVLREL